MADKVSQEQKTPIALFVYNRPAHARLVLETLSRCQRLNECSLRIYCDGPKDTAAAEGVAAARQVAREWAARLGGEVVERETNLGLAHSIVAGVTDLCESHSRVIVLEDDFALNSSFLDYMLQTLDRYADEPNVYQISGYMFPVEHPAKPDAFFLPLTTTWGWATWERAWSVFDWDAAGAFEELQDPKLRRRFDLDGSYPYATMLEQRLRNQNDSWGILFLWTVFKASGLVLHPRESLVWVGGFDQSGTHCGDQTWSDDAALELVSTAAPRNHFALPDRIAPDEAAFNRIKYFLRNETSAGGSILRRLSKKLSARLSA